MTASLDLIWQQARQGQAEAIAHLMNRTLQAKGVRALVRRRGDCLQIMFEAARSLPPQVCVQFVCRGLKQLAPQGVLRVRLHARLLGEEWPEWTQTIDLQETLPAAPSVQTSSNPTTPATTPSHQAVSAFALSLLAIAGTGAVALTLQNQLSVDAPPSAEPSPAITTPEPDVPLVPPPPAPSDRRLRIKAVGDIVLGTNFPSNRLPADPQKLFAQVKPYLQGADLLFGNYESTLTDHPHPFKNTSSGRSFAFRSPPSYAQVLRQAGFNVLNIANNHSYDFNEQGFRDTIRHINAAGMTAIGDLNQITYLEANGLKTAFIGFATYYGQNRIQDLKAGAALVQKAKQNADIVVVSFHGGAEGSDQIHTRDRTEYFYGEDRGNVVQFARTMIDNGADLILGHGPHVPRALELYKGRLIAYSLGNFVGYQTLSSHGTLGKSLILDVELDGSGRFLQGKVIPVRLNAKGIPHIDQNFASVQLIRRLTQADFPNTPLQIERLGEIVSTDSQS
ncbi:MULTISPECIES: CapA family protein [unclassified Thermosynechococcus]|uniref:CapA family protein n=1 Tax=unclassified Thermosynechococcus TaxID=2622553 RepID=UPI002671FB16|nr:MULTISPECIES: CapA family protein [unclassified Thermosynechococcus]WKT82685.1 CapA family protein [Thermosynechococcus sp. HY596]WNC61811.1 CapA family protein [Thermosynechococcus sp. HY591]WNC64365.1 CapA family protein [Thermosynechococcus sp. HY593]